MGHHLHSIEHIRVTRFYIALCCVQVNLTVLNDVMTS